MNSNYLFLILSILIFSSMGLFAKFVSVNGLVIYFFAALISSIIFGIILLKERKLNRFAFKFPKFFHCINKSKSISIWV